MEKNQNFRENIDYKKCAYYAVYSKRKRIRKKHRDKLTLHIRTKAEEGVDVEDFGYEEIEKPIFDSMQKLESKSNCYVKVLLMLLLSLIFLVGYLIYYTI